MNQRIAGIDILRGLAIIAVILLHINIRIPFSHSVAGQWLSSTPYKVIFWSGYYGVMTFFVISGFLITTMSIKRWGNLQHIQYDRFYLLRFARIMPCLITLLIILSILDVVRAPGFIIHHTSLSHALFSALTFHLNWLEAKTGYLPGPWDVLWSLSVEEAFYFLFPLICRVAKNETNFVLLMLVFITLGPLARVVFTHNEIWSEYSYLSCMDGIAFGCLAALFANKITLDSRRLWLYFIAGVIPFIFVEVFRKTVFDWGLVSSGLYVTLLEFGVALMIVPIYLQKKESSFFAPLQWYGKNSYEIYLTHMFFVIILTKLFVTEHQSAAMIPLWYFAILVLSGAFGYIVSRYYSAPLNKLLRAYAKE